METTDVDGRCALKACEHKTDETYVMEGVCNNCGRTDILITLTKGHAAPRSGYPLLQCPTCECRTVKATKLAGSLD